MKKIRVLLATVASLAAVALAMDPGRYAFRFVDVGGHKLRMLISGSGSPTVVFETGGSGAAGGPLEAWEKVQPAVSRFARTVTYDRAGIAWSAPVSGPRDARRIAAELHTALAKAQLPPPYIMVGHSFGGPLIRVFAGMHPSDVAGLVLVDPAQEEFIAWHQAHESNHVERADEEWKDIKASLSQAHESRVPEGIPVILITAIGPRVYPKFASDKDVNEHKQLLPKWRQFHDQWLAQLPNARHIVTDNSGHGVPFEEPDLVIDAIRKVVANGSILEER